MKSLSSSSCALSRMKSSDAKKRADQDQAGERTTATRTASAASSHEAVLRAPAEPATPRHQRVDGDQVGDEPRPEAHTGDLVLLEPAIQRGAAQAERFGHLRDVAAVVLHRLHDHRLLDLVHRHAADRRQHVARRPRRAPSRPVGRKSAASSTGVVASRARCARCACRSCLTLPGHGCCRSHASRVGAERGVRRGDRPAPPSARNRAGQDRDVVAPIAQRAAGAA